uniref:Uncharacterized protein n=1 Tax=Chromera velia CCMP2878 TaxID=1169474 RepID=A0A0G4I408_9ALVE|eukprot:Cvel_10730.t1-p1 / transcript=Cvel_10730.t1 / gene=Cvel_10730 / organism=Chromera_velia_CCMP2878 / gene_product=hypothetical protein / transcript_product=hypothetical protein / location=Cvel_scaffold654:19362-22428(-) / protein_length=903 / sequence_SO=supercontig / SO=protein_coding / is_pseudo=false
MLHNQGIDHYSIASILICSLCLHDRRMTLKGVDGGRSGSCSRRNGSRRQRGRLGWDGDGSSAWTRLYSFAVDYLYKSAFSSSSAAPKAPSSSEVSSSISSPLLSSFSSSSLYSASTKLLMHPLRYATSLTARALRLERLMIPSSSAERTASSSPLSKGKGAAGRERERETGAQTDQQPATRRSRSAFFVSHSESLGGDGGQFRSSPRDPKSASGSPSAGGGAKQTSESDPAEKEKAAEDILPAIPWDEMSDGELIWTVFTNCFLAASWLADERVSLSDWVAILRLAPTPFASLRERVEQIRATATATTSADPAPEMQAQAHVRTERRTSTSVTRTFIPEEERGRAGGRDGHTVTGSGGTPGVVGQGDVVRTRHEMMTETEATARTIAPLVPRGGSGRGGAARGAPLFEARQLLLHSTSTLALSQKTTTTTQESHTRTVTMSRDVSGRRVSAEEQTQTVVEHHHVEFERRCVHETSAAAPGGVRDGGEKERESGFDGGPLFVPLPTGSRGRPVPPPPGEAAVVVCMGEGGRQDCVPGHHSLSRSSSCPPLGNVFSLPPSRGTATAVVRGGRLASAVAPGGLASVQEGYVEVEAAHSGETPPSVDFGDSGGMESWRLHHGGMEEESSQSKQAAVSVTVSLRECVPGDQPLPPHVLQEEMKTIKGAFSKQVSHVWADLRHRLSIDRADFESKMRQILPYARKSSSLGGGALVDALNERPPPPPSDPAPALPCASSSSSLPPGPVPDREAVRGGGERERGGLCSSALSHTGGRSSSSRSIGLVPGGTNAVLFHRRCRSRGDFSLSRGEGGSSLASSFVAVPASKSASGDLVPSGTGSKTVALAERGGRGEREKDREKERGSFKGCVFHPSAAPNLYYTPSVQCSGEGGGEDVLLPSFLPPRIDVCNS